MHIKLDTSRARKKQHSTWEQFFGIFNHKKKNKFCQHINVMMLKKLCFCFVL